MPTFTVKAAMPTGNEDPKYGTEFYVQVNEMPDTAKLWYKTPPVTGSTIELETSKYGWKKVKKEWKPQDQSSDTTSTPEKPTSSYRRTANSDGMRVGMCINNAANYINTLEFPKALTDKEWAETVVAYAKALYAISEFHEVTPETIVGVFGAS